MKAVLSGILILCCLCSVKGQQYKLLESKVTFFSDAPMEDIEATTTKARSLFNLNTGEIAFVIPIRSFEFPKKLMQEHFNENYMESHKYPDATFKGKVSGYDQQKKGKQKVKAKGVLHIHGVSHEVETEGLLELQPKAVRIEAKFPVKVADYKIEIPQLVFYNIAEEVVVSLNGMYKINEK